MFIQNLNIDKYTTIYENIRTYSKQGHIQNTIQRIIDEHF
jgi:hypothetical protein